MLMDIMPLRSYRDYRLLFLGQSISFIGSMVTYVAVPYQMYQLTKSSLSVGLVGLAGVAPLLAFGLWGGAVADAVDRRRLLIASEVAMLIGSLSLAVNAASTRPRTWPLFVATALMAALDGLHRPALESLTPILVEQRDLTAVSALSSFRNSVGAIAGPALGGILIARFGVEGGYLVDVGSFAISVLLLCNMRRIPIEHGEALRDVGFKSIGAGLKYATQRQEILGTYLVDLAAMTFAMPMALFPALAFAYGGAKAAGWLYSSMAIGGLAVTVLSGWTNKVRRHGRAVILAASVWGFAIVALGLTNSLLGAILCLVAAGGSDTISGIFRTTIWNQTIPSALRGRLAGLQIISFLLGPPLGNARAGWVASLVGTRLSIISGGLLSVAAVAASAILVPGLWRYHSESMRTIADRPSSAAMISDGALEREVLHSQSSRGDNE
jgi:MFS family permease